MLLFPEVSAFPNNAQKSQHTNLIKLAYQPGDIFIDADKTRITQVISNLLSNAVKFTEANVNEKGGKERGIINISTEKIDHSMAVVSIKDTGIGIHPEIIPKLFTKFASKSVLGGIEAHGGKIWAENNKERKDATFSFSLHLADNDDKSYADENLSKTIEEK
jgi:signal transduction histidine kinase